jgi:hypothetical protein
MTEPETEAETLDRLEAALTRIAAHAAPVSRPRQEPIPQSPDPAITEALDIMIARLRSVLQPRGES